jgi:hypothetical protein
MKYCPHCGKRLSEPKKKNGKKGESERMTDFERTLFGGRK